ncbi:hypothetical protein YM80_001601 [Salmonella enterica subsp. salamae]|nr:hypothetical protein [Salmonella enterica subsp. salamae]
MIRLFLFFIVFLIGCDSPTKKIGIYTVDMEYACESTSYRIFRFTTLIDGVKDIESTDISSVNEDISRAYNTVLTRKDDFLLSGNHSLSGVEVSLIFRSKNSESTFEKNTPYYNKCYVYYFEGQFKNKRLRFDRDGDQDNEFIVDSYKYFLKSPDCIKNVYATH